ncbi:TPA: hypothetical protein ACMDNU_003675, partial [Vibrio cholerae]
IFKLNGYMKNKTPYDELKEKVKLGHYDNYKVCNCSDLVKDAILYVRSLSVDSAGSVEMATQAARLNEYERYLRNKYK